MYDIEKLYQAKDIGDAIRALKEDPEAVVPWSAFTESKSWKA